MELDDITIRSILRNNFKLEFTINKDRETAYLRYFTAKTLAYFNYGDATSLSIDCNPYILFMKEVIRELLSYLQRQHTIPEQFIQQINTMGIKIDVNTIEKLKENNLELTINISKNLQQVVVTDISENKNLRYSLKPDDFNITGEVEKMINNLI